MAYSLLGCTCKSKYSAAERIGVISRMGANDGASTATERTARAAVEAPRVLADLLEPELTATLQLLLLMSMLMLSPAGQN